MKKMDPVERLNYENKVKSGAGWFTIIALLTLINTIITISGQDWGFAVGLGITIFTDLAGVALSEQFGILAKVGAVVFSLICAGTFFAVGVAASKRKVSMYVLGTLLYGIDTLITLVTVDPVAIGIHVVVLVLLVQSIVKCRKLNRIIAEEDAMEDDNNPLLGLFPNLVNESATPEPAVTEEPEVPATPAVQMNDAPPPLPAGAPAGGAAPVPAQPAIPESESEPEPQPTPAVHAPTAEIAAAMASLATPSGESVSEPVPPPPSAPPAAVETESTSRLKVLYRD